MLRSTYRHPYEEHLPNETLYPFLPTYPARHAPLGRHNSGRWCAAHHDCGGHKSGSGAASKSGPVAQAAGNPRPGKVLSNLTLSLALGGDFLAVLRAKPGLHSQMTSEVTASRTTLSSQEKAAPTFKQTFGFHPLLAFCDHGADGQVHQGADVVEDRIRITRDTRLTNLPSHGSDQNALRCRT